MTEVLSEKEKTTIREAVSELSERDGRPLKYDERYCVYKTEENPAFENYDAVKQFVQSVVEENGFNEDLNPVIRVDAPDVNVCDSVSISEDAPEESVSFAVFITYTFQ